MMLTINELQTSLTQSTDAAYELQKESKIEKNKLINESTLIKLRYNKLENKLDSVKEKLSKYNPRNVTKLEKKGKTKTSVIRGYKFKSLKLRKNCGKDNLKLSMKN